MREVCYHMHRWLSKHNINTDDVSITINSTKGSRSQEFKFNLKADEMIKKVLINQIVTTNKAVFNSDIGIVK